MCDCRAEGLKCVLTVLGIAPYTKAYINENPEPNSNAYWDEEFCSTCQKDFERKYSGGHWLGALRLGGDGSTCYAPSGRQEGTYAEIEATLGTYFWVEIDGSIICPHLGDP